MWPPRTEADLQLAIAEGLLRETSSFDAKAALPAPGRNKDLAKDICAMTVDGGLLFYGVGGEDPTRPNELMPFDLAGQAERIDQVAHTGIAEPPAIEIRDIQSESRPGLGYLAVTIPPSPRAPHMLTIDRDNRFWGRAETGNRILTEGEVARLYERRDRQNVDRDRIMATERAAVPFTSNPTDVGPVLAFARPVAQGRELLRLAAEPDGVRAFLQGPVRAHARDHDPHPSFGASALHHVAELTMAGDDNWIYRTDPDGGRGVYQAWARFEANGSLVHWVSPSMRTDDDRTAMLMERAVTRALTETLAVASFIFEQAGFFGAVDIGLGVYGIEHASGASTYRTFTHPTYGADAYERHDRVSVQQLSASLEDVARDLLRPLFEVISITGYEPFNDA